MYHVTATTKLTPFYSGQMGVPGSESPQGIRHLPEALTLYVDPSAPMASDVNDGVNPEYPMETITAALAKCTSGHGDQIIIMPGSYAENLVVTKDYISFIGGLPGGYARPDIEGDGDVALTVHAQGFHAQHIRFAADTGEDAVVQQGNGFLYDDCVFDGDGANDFNLLPDLDDDSYTASEGKIINCVFRYGNKGLMFTNPGPGIEGGVGPTDVLVEHCRFTQHTTNSIDDTDTAGSNDKTFTDCFVNDCLFVETGVLFAYIDLTAGASNTGMISNCCFADADITVAQVALPAGVFSIGNHDGTYSVVP